MMMHIHCRKITLQFITTCICSMISLCAWAVYPYYDAELSYSHDTNINNADFSRDRLEDDILIAGVTASLPVPLTQRSGLLLSANTEYHYFTQWEDISEWSLGGKLTYRYKPGMAFNAMWYEFMAGGSLLLHQDSSLRDGGQVYVDLGLGKSLTDRIQLRGGYHFNVRRAWDSVAYDTETHRVYANVDWKLVSRINLYGNLGWQYGDVVSSVVITPGGIYGGGPLSIQTEPDSALSDGVQQRGAYNINARTAIGTLGLNYAITQKLALDASARYARSEGDKSLSYEGFRFLCGLLYRF